MPRDIRASSLRQQVEIHRRRDAPSGDFEADSETQLVATVAAMIAPVAAATYQESVNTGDKVTHRMYIGYRDDLTASHAVIYRGAFYRVVSSRQYGPAFRFSEVMLCHLGASDGAGGVAGSTGQVWQ